jgi:hypothetical protein
MKRLWVGLAALLLLGPALLARDDPKDKPQTPAEQYKALVQEYNQAQQEFMKEYRAAKPEERQQLIKDKMPQPQKYAGRFLELAEKNAKDPVAVDALVWVAQNGRGTKEADKALDTLFQDHSTNPRLASIVQMLAYDTSAKAEGRLKQVLEKADDKALKGTACFFLGMHYKNRLSRGPAPAKDEAERLKTEANAAFARAVKEFGDVKVGRGTIADGAEKQLKALKALENLVVGKVAPEIEGEDIDGQQFKLSDYRGKVVVLDFWGHW